MGHRIRRRWLDKLVCVDRSEHTQPTAIGRFVIPLCIVDPAEESLPDLGLILIEDAETGAPILIDSGSGSVRNAYEKAHADDSSDFDATLKKFGVTPITVRTNTEDYAAPLVNFFKLRASRAS